MSGSAPSIYQYGQEGTADANAIGGTGALYNYGQDAQNLYSSAVPGLTGLTAGTNYNPQSGVDTGNNITGAVSSLPGYALSALGTGFNQNNGLYNQELNSINDSTNSGLAARGLATTPYAAGVQGAVDTNFNNTWQQQQLQNQSTAATTADNLLGTYGTQSALGAQTSQGAADNSLSALSSLLGSANTADSGIQSAIQDYLSYLTGGTQAGSAQATATNASNALTAQGLGGLGSLFGTLFGGGSGGFSNSALGSLFA